MKKRTKKDEVNRAGMRCGAPVDKIVEQKQVRYLPLLGAIRCCAANCGTRNFLPKNTADLLPSRN